MERKWMMKTFHIRSPCSTSPQQKGSLLGIVSSSSQNILHHKMQHAPFLHRPLVSLSSVKYPPLQIHPSDNEQSSEGVRSRATHSSASRWGQFWPSELAVATLRSGAGGPEVLVVTMAAACGGFELRGCGERCLLRTVFFWAFYLHRVVFFLDVSNERRWRAHKIPASLEARHYWQAEAERGEEVEGVGRGGGRPQIPQGSEALVLEKCVSEGDRDTGPASAFASHLEVSWELSACILWNGIPLVLSIFHVSKTHLHCFKWHSVYSGGAASERRVTMWYVAHWGYWSTVGCTYPAVCPGGQECQQHPGLCQK